MKRVLLHQDTNLFSEITSDLNQYLPLLNKLKSSYESLELGKLNNEIFKGITTSTGINKIQADFNKNLDNQIDKLGISASVLKENLLNGSKALFEDFEDAVKALKRFKPDTYSRVNSLKLKFISFKDEVFYLSEADKEDILENNCRVYLENEKEIELHSNLKNFIEAAKKVTDNLNELQFVHNYRANEEIAAIRNTFLKSEGTSYSIIPSSISFACNYKNNSLKYK